LQVEQAECGLACIAMVAAWHGQDSDLTSLRSRFPVSLNGTTLKDLMTVASALGLGARAVRCDLEDLGDLRSPCILHWDFDHFVVLEKVKGDIAIIHDPAVGERRLSLAQISPHFTGVALELTPMQAFKTGDQRLRLRLRDLWSWTGQSRGAFGKILLLSVLLEVAVLLSPLYSQLLIDEVILKKDEPLLVGLLVAFVLVSLFNVTATMLRSLVSQYLATTIAFEMTARLFHHLVRLPLSYFSSRSLGDITARMDAQRPIAAFIMNGGIAAIPDGVFGLLAGVMMMLYSPKLSAIAAGAVLAYVILRLAFLPLSRRLATEQIVVDTREQTALLETIRSIQSIKVMGRERQREAQWRNLATDCLNAAIRTGNVGIMFAGASEAVSLLSNVVMWYFAAKMALTGQLTIGMIFAFMAYASQFMSRMTALVGQLISFRMLAVQLERLSDIVHAEREGGGGAGSEVTLPPDVFSGDIEAKKLSFAYGAADRKILKETCLTIRPGEFVAIVGPSGAGKTTLLKILIGLLEPSSGEIFYSGHDLGTFHPSAFRQRLGVVMQEDRLLTGSIAQNIAGFDDKIDMEAVRQAARAAAVEDDIMALPMQFNSLVGDLGNVLSTGQRQRVLLARALYRDPALLVLDEGTAHLDPASEARVIQSIKALSMTRIAVAHSAAMAYAADRVIEFRDGTVHDVELPPD
jgi:ATP-binding cassette subfamily B protein RaxB